MKRNPQISEFEQAVIDIITDFRKSRKLTQQNYADILKVSRAFIADVENFGRASKYNLDHINAFADYFGMSPREFLPENPFPV